MPSSSYLKFIILFLVVSCLCACNRESTRRVCLGNACIMAEVADSGLKRQQGLMFRKSLSDNDGMLFIFDEEEQHAFWMQNMLISLDIIWINREKEIVDIVIDAPPCNDSCSNMIPRSKAKYVLEVRSGFIQKYNIKIGQRVIF